MNGNAVILLAVIVFVAVIAGLVLQNPEPAVRIGYQPLTVNLPLFVAYEDGLFNKTGVKVDLVRFETTNQITDALLANKIDATGIIALQTLLSIEARTPGAFKAFAFNQQTPSKHIDALIARKDSDIANISDLKGKRVGVFPGSSTKAIAEVMLSRFMNTSDVTIVELAPSLQIDALKSGQVDALITLEPIPTTAISLGVAKLVEETPMSKYVVENFTLGAAVVSSRFMDENPELAGKVIEAFYAGIDKANADENQRGVLSIYLSLKPEIAAKVGVGNVVKAREANLALIQKLSDIYYDNGQSAESVNVTQFIIR